MKKLILIIAGLSTLSLVGLFIYLASQPLGVNIRESVMINQNQNKAAEVLEEPISPETAETGQVAGEETTGGMIDEVVPVDEPIPTPEEIMGETP